LILSLPAGRQGIGWPFFGHPKKVTKDKMHEIGNFDYRKHLPATFPKEYPHSHNFILTVRMFIKFEK
jgi:hypothetical protein